MRKVLNRICIIALSCLLIVCANIKSSHAFGPYPPMPFDIVLDVPANAGKVVSVLQETKRYYDSVKRYKKALSIKAVVGKIKLFALEQADKLGIDPDVLKNGVGGALGGGDSEKIEETGYVLAKNSRLGLDKEGETDEEKLKDAFYKVFLIYPAESDEMKDSQKQRVKLAALKTIHKQKTIEYRQDVAMSTYLFAQKRELFLDVIERTIDRLDACQKAMGADSGFSEPEEGCVFFGMAMVEVPSQEEAPAPEGGDSAEGSEEGGEETPAGQSEEMQNAYVVSMVYDRLLRFIEELTAVEAELKASQQIELVVPAEQGEAQSDASDYINNTFKFAYSDYYEASHADILPKPKPVYNTNDIDGEYETATQKTPDVGKLQAIESILNNAIQVHNLKSQLPDYKMQYRQYLMSKKIHERAYNTLKDNETCIIDFIDDHNGDLSGKEQWRGSANPFKSVKDGVDHDVRSDGSISKTLLMKYQSEADKKILGTLDEEKCKNYYIEGSVCPSGYSLDVSENSACKDETGALITDNKGNKLYPCIVKTVTPDVPEGNMEQDFAQLGKDAGKDPFAPDEEEGETDSSNEEEDPFAKAGISDPNDENSFNENEFMANSEQSDQLENDTRKKNELTWRIGAEKMLELTESGVLSFKPWKDQEYLQREYLRNKYRNLRIIVKSMDQAKLSYMIIKEKVIGQMNFSDDLLGNLTEVSKYVPLSEVASKAKADHCNKNGFYCTSCGSLTCGPVLNKSEGKVVLHGYKKETRYKKDSQGNNLLDEEGNPITYIEKVPVTKTFHSQVLGKQDYVNEAKSTEDFVKVFLDMPNDIKEAYLRILANNSNENGTKTLGNKFYKVAYEKGRRVARDLLENVLNSRKEANNELTDFLNSYYGDNGSITKLKKEIENQKASLDRFVAEQDKAQQEKNEATDEEKRTKERIVDIERQIKVKKEQINKLTEEYNNEKNKVLKALKEQAISGVNKLILALQAEEQYLSNAKVACTKEVDKNCPTDEYLPQAVIEVNKNNAVSKLQNAKDRTNEIKASITEKQSLLEEKVEDFTVEYIEQANKTQNKIEASNKGYEDFVEPLDADSSKESDIKRMINNNEKECIEMYDIKLLGCKTYGQKTLNKDNLENTVIEFYNAGEPLEDHVRKFVEQYLTEELIVSELNKLNIADEFYLSSELVGLNLAIGFKSGVVSNVAKIIKDAVVEHTVKEIVELVISSDEIVQNEMDRALSEIAKVTTKLGVEIANGNTNSEIDIFNATNYSYIIDDDGTYTPSIVTELHEKMVEELSKSTLPLSEDIIKDVYSIPSLSKDANAKHEQGAHPLVDNEYFVALPARGVMNNDIDSGRDYTAPKGPMMNLPPLREVFYYSPLDYDDVPKEGNGKKRKKKERFSPSISHLLEQKYDTDWEYLPEIWRYILAVPSLRKDGKFQQTFMERSMDGVKLNKYLNGEDSSGSSKSNNKYAHIIARAGVYPCQIGNKIIDVQATMDIKEKKNGDVLSGYNIKYIYTNVGEGSAYPKCKEVQLSGTNKIKHLLADEDKNTASLVSDSSAKKQYEGASELGQLIDVNKQYRWFLQEAYKFLTNTTTTKKKRNKGEQTPPNQINNVWRQLHDLSAYKRNLFGSFLDNVSAEKDAKNNLENAEYQLTEVLKQLCEQVHELGVTVGDTAEEFQKIDEKCSQCEDCDDICSEEAVSSRKTEICANYIMNSGLAKNVDDKAYGVTEYKGYEGVKNNSKSIYDEIYFLLDDKKDSLLNDKQSVSPADSDTNEEIMATYKEVIEEFRSEFFDHDKGRWKPIIEDRMLAIELMYDSLTRDNNEVAYITPDSKVNVETAMVNRLQSFKSSEEGLKGMDNQSKVVPYCPSY